MFSNLFDVVEDICDGELPELKDVVGAAIEVGTVVAAVDLIEDVIEAIEDDGE